MNVEPVRKILPYTTFALVIALIYVGYTFYNRKTEDKRVEEQAQASKVERDRDSVSRMGGTALKISGFYANPGAVKKGEAAKLCYGVVNAKSVELEPSVEHVWPSLSRCFDVRPSKSTHYTLTAKDEEGHTVTQTAEIAVQ